MPRMLPNRIASKFLLKVRVEVINKTPIAKPAVVTTPIAASALIFYFLLISFIIIAETNPQSAAVT